MADTYKELAALLGSSWSRNVPGLIATSVHAYGDTLELMHYNDTLVEAHHFVNKNTPVEMHHYSVVVRAPRSISSAARVARFSPIRFLSDSVFGGWRFSFEGVEYWTPRGTVELIDNGVDTIVKGAVTRKDARKLGPDGRAAFRGAVWATVKAQGVADWMAFAGASELAAALIDMTPRARDLVAPLMANGLSVADALACAPAVAR